MKGDHTEGHTQLLEVAWSMGIPLLTRLPFALNREVEAPIAMEATIPEALEAGATTLSIGAAPIMPEAQEALPLSEEVPPVHPATDAISNRLRRCLPQWRFASKMSQRLIHRGLTWKWELKPPALHHPPFSTCKDNLQPHISKLLSLGAIIESHHASPAGCSSCPKCREARD